MNEAVVLQEIVVDESRKPCDIHYLAVNPAFERHTGMKASEFVGHNASELFPGSVNEWLGRYEELTRSGAPRRFEDWFAPLGRWFGSTLFPTEPGQFCHVLQDITERKRAEEALRESENRYRTLFSNMSEEVYYWKLVRDESGAIVNWRLVDANPAALRTWDKAPTEVQGRTPDEIFGAEATRHFMPVVQKIFREGVSYSHEGYFPELNRKFQFNSVPLGEYFLTTGGDITEREKADERLRASEEKFAKAFAASPAAVAIARLDGLVLDVNGAWVEMHGYSREEVVGLPADELSIWPSPKERARFVADLKRDGLVQGREQLLFRKSGERFDALYSAVVVGVGGEEIVVSTLVDTTERKRADASVRESRAKLEAALASMTDAVFISDAEGRFIEFNDAFATFHKFRSKEECARTFAEYPGILDVFFADGTPAPVDMWAVPRALRGETATNAEYRLRRKDTGEAWIGSYSFAPIRDAGGAVVGSVVVGRDITEWKRTEEALRLTQASVDRAAEMVVWFTPDGRVHYANDATCRTLLYSREELLQMTALDFSPGFTWERYQEHWAEVRNRKSFTVEVTHRRKDGAEYPAEVLVNHVVYRGQEYIFAYGRDITERKQAEQALHESEARLAAVMENLMEGLIIADGKGRVFYWNSAALAMFGYASMDECRRRLAEFAETFEVRPLDDDRGLPVADWPISRVLSGEVLRNLEVRTRRLDQGWEKILSYSGWLIRSASGEMLAFVSISDITERKRVEHALQRSEIRFRSVFENAATGIVITDLDGRFQQVNPAYAAMLGYTVEELVSLDFPRLSGVGGKSSLIQPQDQPAILEKLLRLKAGELPSFEIESRYVRKDGQPISVRNFVSTLPDPTGKPAHILALVTDITERKRAEAALAESEQRYRSLFESMQEAFMLGEVIFDEAGEPCDWRYLDVNPYYEEIYGCKREEVVGKTYRKVLPGSHSDHWIEIAGRVTLTGKGETFASKSNTGRYLEGTVYCPQPGQFAAIVTDASARREAEEQVRRLNADLEDRVRDRTAQLEAANEELEAFAYSVSHDLRSPLRGIDGWSLALVEDYANQLDEQAREYLGRIRSEAQRMGLLIDDMLQLSRITRAQMEKKPIDLTAVATAVAKRLQASELDRRIEFVIPAALTGKGDAGLLEIALTNLLGNAVKFTGRREDARIEFGTAEINGERAFFVRDNGVGFNMASAGKLFGAFQRLHKASQFPGTGIGLATVQRIIHRHGGRVWADAERGKGATFYFTLDSK